MFVNCSESDPLMKTSFSAGFKRNNAMAGSKIPFCSAPVCWLQKKPAELRR